MMDWQAILFGDDPWTFIFEVILRSTIMFIVVLISLRLMGQRAIMQGIFEIALIIALGSAGGDAMFYGDVGLIPTTLVFAVIIAMYRIIHYIMAKNRHFEKFMQGKLIYLIENGEFLIESFKDEDFGVNEIFSDLRLKNISHLGQLKTAYIEPSGAISVFFYADEEVKYGLPILPRKVDQELTATAMDGYYACAQCGHTTLFAAPVIFVCTRCENKTCVKASNSIRLS